MVLGPVGMFNDGVFGSMVMINVSKISLRGVWIDLPVGQCMTFQGNSGSHKRIGA